MLFAANQTNLLHVKQICLIGGKTARNLIVQRRPVRILLRLRLLDGPLRRAVLR
jgi:hypothetical protein